MDSLAVIPRYQSLNDYTDEEVRKIYALPGLAVAEEIKRLLSLFVIRNQFGNHTIPDQRGAGKSTINGLEGGTHD